MKKTFLSTKNLVILAMLLAMEIIFSRFLSISTWQIKIGFNFIPVALAGALFGPVAGGLVGGLGDLFGALLFPIGPYFPGFTITAAACGVVFGFALKKNPSTPKLCLAAFINQIVFGLFINTAFISILYNVDYMLSFPIRSLQALIMITVQIVVMSLLMKGVPVIRRFSFEGK